MDGSTPPLTALEVVSRGGVTRPPELLPPLPSLLPLPQPISDSAAAAIPAEPAPRSSPRRDSRAAAIESQ
jgi:hypothetical protein